MYGLFRMRASFDDDVSRWNTGSVKDMSFMFYGASSFNGNLGKWNTSQVTSMESMFEDAIAFRGEGLGSWDTRSVTDMRYMFHATVCLNAVLDKWNTAKVTNMKGMFSFAKACGPSKGWDTQTQQVGHATCHRYELDVRFFTLMGT
ncbi:hypothetical protein MHU86_11725 [Fragilaria crotonensis]|nr:hypothetical protein MHU86_11725 [Fragilaria crotonensis]